MTPFEQWADGVTEFLVMTNDCGSIRKGDTVVLDHDDGTECPFFIKKCRTSVSLPFSFTSLMPIKQEKKMTPFEKFAKGATRFRVTDKSRSHLPIGTILTLWEDDETDAPLFWLEDKSDWHCIHLSSLEPINPKKKLHSHTRSRLLHKRKVLSTIIEGNGTNTLILDNYDWLNAIYGERLGDTMMENCKGKILWPSRGEDALQAELDAINERLGTVTVNVKSSEPLGVSISDNEGNKLITISDLGDNFHKPNVAQETKPKPRFQRTRP